MVFAAASQLLHFYLDGFIWKVREPETARVVGVEAMGSVGTVPATGFATWPVMRHALLWLLVLVPYGLLLAGESRANPQGGDRLLAIAERVPDFWLYRFAAAETRWQRGEKQAAVEGFRAALVLDPSQRDVRKNLALSLCELAEAATAAHDRARLEAIVSELDRVRADLDTTTASFVESNLSIYRATVDGLGSQ